MKQVPRISIITVCYNAAETIHQAMQSVLGQTAENIEYIVVDGNSTDGTKEYLQRCTDQRLHWLSEPDKGIYDAMDKGLVRAEGDYIYYLGADDCVADPFVMEKICCILAKDTDIDVLSGPVWMVDPRYRIEKLYSNRFTQEDVYQGYSIPHQGLFVKRVILEKYGFDKTYRIAADYKCFLQLYFAADVRFKFIDAPVAFYAADGRSAELTVERMEENIRAMSEAGMPTAYVESYRQLTAGQRKTDEMGFKSMLRNILRKTDLLKYVRQQRGWRVHHCVWKGCRWCKE